MEKQTVFLAKYGYFYEGEVVLGVFSTKEKAQAALDEHCKLINPDDYPDNQDVVETEVQ